MRAIFFSISDSLEKKGLERGENGLCGVGKSMKVGGIQVSGEGGKWKIFPGGGIPPISPLGKTLRGSPIPPLGVTLYGMQIIQITVRVFLFLDVT